MCCHVAVLPKLLSVAVPRHHQKEHLRPLGTVAESKIMDFFYCFMCSNVVCLAIACIKILCQCFKGFSNCRKASPIRESLVLHIDALTRNVNEGHLKEIFSMFFFFFVFLFYFIIQLFLCLWFYGTLICLVCLLAWSAYNSGLFKILMTDILLENYFCSIF